MDSALSIKNASGKTFSLLNDNSSDMNNIAMNGNISTFKVSKLTSSMDSPVSPRRKYHCSESGCNKSFTTSGHLARHNRIHTGEKNFHCLHPGCPSRFSRQDNMMQHYRTHLSQKMRRQQHQKKEIKQQPQLYCHSFHEREEYVSFQPLLMTRQQRSRAVTMPSLPYPTMDNTTRVYNRPRRALSTSSTCSDSSASSFSSPPRTPMNYNYHHQLLPPPTTVLPLPFSNMQPQQYQHHTHHTHHIANTTTSMNHHEWAPNTQKPRSALLNLANIVSTFG